jgi:hypothetical protein
MNSIYCNSTALYLGEEGACNLTVLDSYDIVCTRRTRGGIECSVSQGTIDVLIYFISGILGVIFYFLIGKHRNLPDFNRIANWELCQFFIRIFIDILIK